MSIMQTARVSLRELEFGDAEFILELLNEAGFIRFIGDKGVRTIADARDYIQQGPMDSYARNGFGLYAACLRGHKPEGKPAGTPIGICGLVKREGLTDPDVGFAFLSRYWSKGYAVESAAAVLTHARQVLNLGRIVAITSPDNSQSIAVLEKIGLKFERTIRLVDHSPELKLFGLPTGEPGP
ncbi:MAG: GNAT family N-acetyltransferase [Pseudomonadota bacterium]|nr:GNAT family N-acetyltransferase [Pseudomonadota bacterium]